MPKVSRAGDSANCPGDSHGKKCCSHDVTGPAVSGSPDVFINGRPALRIGGPGVHSACRFPASISMDFFKLVIMAFVVCALCLSCSQNPDYKSYDDRFLAAVYDEDKLRTLRDDITRELARHQDDGRLLKLRAGISNFLGDDDEFETDLNRLADLYPKTFLYAFQRCLFRESRYGYSDTSVQCYADMLVLFEDASVMESPHGYPNYILFASMAERPNARSMREQFVRDVRADSPEAYWKPFLEYFDRDYFTGKKQLPPELLPENLPLPPAFPSAPQSGNP